MPAQNSTTSEPRESTLGGTLSSRGSCTPRTELVNEIGLLGRPLSQLTQNSPQLAGNRCRVTRVRVVKAGSENITHRPQDGGTVTA